MIVTRPAMGPGLYMCLLRDSQDSVIKDKAGSKTKEVDRRVDLFYLGRGLITQLPR